MKISIYLLAITGALSMAATAQAQHYPVGVEGIKGATLPPPGIYLRDYNVGYYASHLEPVTPPGFKAKAYINAPRLIWMTDKKIFGANYGMDIIVPFGYREVTAPGVADSHFGLYDIQVEPLLLGWHFDRFDVGAGYSFWAPVGKFNPLLPRPADWGTGYWTHMLTLGATYYVDAPKTWAISALNRYEMHHEQDITGLTRGHDWTLEWGISKTLAKTWDVGLIGYYQTQVTSDATPWDHVVGLGPEISVAFPKQMFFASLRYVREVDASNRPKGNLVSLTLTKRF